MPARRAFRAVSLPQTESFLFKSLLLVSALFIAVLVMAQLEFYFSGSLRSLSETEAVLRLGH